MVYQFHRPNGNETSVKICKLTTGITDKKLEDKSAPHFLLIAAQLIQPLGGLHRYAFVLFALI
jgi:hypothetical protein